MKFECRFYIRWKRRDDQGEGEILFCFIEPWNRSWMITWRFEIDILFISFEIDRSSNYRREIFKRERTSPVWQSVLLVIFFFESYLDRDEEKNKSNRPIPCVPTSVLSLFVCLHFKYGSISSASSSSSSSFLSTHEQLAHQINEKWRQLLMDFSSLRIYRNVNGRDQIILEDFHFLFFIGVAILLFSSHLIVRRCSCPFVARKGEKKIIFWLF